MAYDKAIDSTQLNADLTSVANAIRTKGGTSASLAFPAGFVQAIGDIPTGGGGTHSASGDITVVSDISITTEDPQSVNFPGLQLQFQPDYLCLWYDLDEYKAAGRVVPLYCFILVIRNQTTFPPLRISSSLSTLSAGENSDYLFFITYSYASCSDPLANGNAASVAGACFVNLSVSSGWSVNSDGTLTISNRTNGTTLGAYSIKAGTWHYYALKG